MLTDKTIKALAPAEKPYKRSDEKGLYLIVRPDGARWWRFKYRIGGREKLLSLGTYPETTLKAARDARDAARAGLLNGIDPSAKRQATKTAKADTLEAVANEWFAAGCPSKRRRSKAVSEGTVEQLRQRLKTYVIPYLGRWPLADVTAPELLKVLRRIEGKGNHETAHRVRSLVSGIFRFAIATGRAERDPAADLIGALAAVSTTHFAAVTDKKRVGALLRAIDGYQGQPAVMAALKLAPRVFVRPGELRGARWAEFDLDAAEWLIPAERMKMGREHVVPLPTQAVEILTELERHTGNGELLFPSLRHKDRPISDNTLNACLRSLGYGKEDQTAHGFRTIASTFLHELGYDTLLIELQLAHRDKNAVRDSYNRAERLDDRRKMMQAYSDYLDGLKVDTGEKVRAIRGG